MIATYAPPEYEATALVYDGMYADARSRAENAVLRRILRHTIRKGDAVLDVACGTGLLLDLLSIEEKRYLGIDASPSMIGVARAKHPDHRFIVGDMHELPPLVPAEDADVVVCLFSLGHAAHLTRVLRDLRWCVRPGGRLIATVPTKLRAEVSPYPQRSYSPLSVWNALYAGGWRSFRLSGLSTSSRTYGPLTRLLVEWERYRDLPLPRYQHVVVEARRG